MRALVGSSPSERTKKVSKTGVKRMRNFGFT